jgi:vacuolar protein sorting-associated protein 13A/C
MLENWFKNLILNILGRFIEDFESKDLVVEKWNGQVVQQHCRIKRSALDFLSSALGLPLEVVHGVIGELRISFNWAKLKSQPIRIFIKDCFILCKPREAFDPSIWTRKCRSAKRAKLSQIQLAPENEGYLKSLTNTIKDNIVI